MNLSRILLIISILAVAEVSAQECKAKIAVSTDLATCGIYINQDLVGNGNAAIELEPGRYILTVTREPKGWDSQSYLDTLNIDSCIDTTISFSFNKQVYLNTDPQDVDVYQDSLLIGHTPLFLPLNAPAVHLKKSGYESINIVPGHLQSNRIIKLNFTGVKRGESFFEKNIFKVLVGGIVALGGVTAYFKLKADDNFDQYQMTGDNYYLDRTHKFDLISGVTFGALQVGLGFLIYHFLSE
jgi:hypothetical protein